MSTTFTNFAVVGAGAVGSVVVDELLKKNLHVTVLTRDDAKPELQDFKNRGAVLAKVDYKDPENLVKALAGIEVVVSVLSPFAHDVEENLVHAAKASGAKLFVPAEYGIKKPTTNPEWFYQADVALRDLLKQLDLPYTVFHNGFFYEYLPVGLNHNYKEGKIQIVGDGKYPISLTWSKEVGLFVAHVLSTAAKKDLEWATISFEGERTTPLEIAARAEKKLGKKIEITYVDMEENKKLAEKDFNAALTKLAVEGHGVSGTEEEVAAAKAKYFPEWKPTPYDGFIQ